VSCDAITLCDASQRVFIVVYFDIDSVRKLLDTPSYVLPLPLIGYAHMNNLSFVSGRGVVVLW
jgi:hypothetical protein